MIELHHKFTIPATLCAKSDATLSHKYESISHFLVTGDHITQFCAGSPQSYTFAMTKAESEKRRSLARALFLSGMEMAEIADKVDVSRVTISKWCAADGWREARAAKSITRPELVNKLLLAIDSLIEQVNQSNDPKMIAGLGDKLSKLSSVIEKLDKKANVVTAVEVFMAFSKWLEFRSKSDPAVTVELIKTINRYQDMFLTENMSRGSLVY